MDEPSDATQLVEALIKWAKITAAEDPFSDGPERWRDTLYGQAADFITQARARATAAERENLLLRQDTISVLQGRLQTAQDQNARLVEECGRLARVVTRAEALLETARKVLEPFAALAGKPIRFVADGSVRVAVDTEHFGQAASFLSSLKEPDQVSNQPRYVADGSLVIDTKTGYPMGRCAHPQSAEAYARKLNRQEREREEGAA